MKFFCEYCGNRIDAEKDSKCPNCGASYKKNQSFIKLENERKQQIQTNNENAKKIANHIFGIFQFSGVMFFIPVVIFIIIIITAIIMTTNVIKKNSNSDNNINEIFETAPEETNDNEEQESIVVGLDEFAETKEYKVKVTKYEKQTDMFNRLDKDHEYVKFHLIVENLSDDRLTKEDVNCIVDGIAQTNYYSSGYSDLPMFINKGLTVKGVAVFEVPVNTTSYDIKYGDNIIIHIEK